MVFAPHFSVFISEGIPVFVLILAKNLSATQTIPNYLIKSNCPNSIVCWIVYWGPGFLAVAGFGYFIPPPPSPVSKLDWRNIRRMRKRKTCWEEVGKPNHIRPQVRQLCSNPFPIIQRSYDTGIQKRNRQIDSLHQRHQYYKKQEKQGHSQLRRNVSGYNVQYWILP